jgi:hypothetical protein
VSPALYFDLVPPPGNEDRIARRLTILLRGPGVLVLALGAAILATAAHRSHGLFARSATATPVPIPFSAALSSQQVASDSSTGMQVWARDARITVAASRHGVQPVLDAQLQLRNSSVRAQPFDASSFYLVATGGSVPAGTTIPAHVPPNSVAGGQLPPVGNGALGPGSVRTGWDTFYLPSRPATYVMIWTDDDRLLTPATVASIAIRRSSGATR